LTTLAVHRNTHLGSSIALTLAATVGFSAYDTCTKLAGVTVPLLVVLWMRYAVQAGLTAAWLLKTVGRVGFRVGHWRFQCLRGLLMIGIGVFGFLGLKVMPVAEFTAIAMLTPVIVTALSPWLLKEHVSPVRWALVLVAFAGALIVVRPGSGLFGLAAIVPLILAITNAFFQLVTRRMAGLDAPLTTHFCSGLLAMLGLSALMPFAALELPNLLPSIPPTLWGLMFLGGSCSALGHLAFIKAVGRAPMPVLMPFTYAQIAVAAFFGLVVFSHAPDGWGLVGMAVIAGSGAASVWVNMRSQRKASVVEVDTALTD
jgi:drug/metabolite transporter (DMT)-like permease